MSTVINDDAIAQDVPPQPIGKPTAGISVEMQDSTTEPQPEQSTNNGEADTPATESDADDKEADNSAIDPDTVAVAEVRSGKPDWYLASRPKNWLWIALWWMYGLFGCYKYRFIPVPRYWGSYRRRIRENRRFMYKNEAYSKGIFSFHSLKGGALKTTVSTWSAAENAASTTGTTLLIDADSGMLESAARRFLVYLHTKFLRFPNAARLILHKGWIPTNEEILEFAPRHEESGAYILTMDEVTHFTGEQMKHVLETFKPAVGSLFVDPGPGNKEPNSPGVLKASTVVTITGIHQNEDSIAGVHGSLATESYGLRQRIDNGETVFIAIGGVSWLNFNKRTQYEQAAEFGVSPESVVLLPDHKHIIKSRPVRRKAVSLKFRYAISNLNRLRVEAAIAYNQQHALAVPAAPISEEELSEDERLMRSAQTFMHHIGEDAERASIYLMEKFGNP